MTQIHDPAEDLKAERPDRDQLLLGVAGLFAKRSTCSRASVGVVIARDGRIISTGYNGAPAGMPHCDHPEGDDEPCRVSVHAEANAISFAARHGQATEGATLYTTHSPCLACAQVIVNSGIGRVVVGQMYRDPGGFELLLDAGLMPWPEVDEMDMEDEEE